MLLLRIVYSFVGNCTIHWCETMADLKIDLVWPDKLKPTIKQGSSVLQILVRTYTEIITPNLKSIHSDTENIKVSLSLDVDGL